MSPGLFWALHFKRGPAHGRHLTRSGCFATIPRLSENQPAHVEFEAGCVSAESCTPPHGCLLIM